MASDAHLVLAGPVVTAVADDPEAAVVAERHVGAVASDAHHQRSRVQLVCLPMSDIEENAVIVNALQRHAAVVSQKSLAEGFGLTVTEAMYKGRSGRGIARRRDRRPDRRRRERPAGARSRATWLEFGSTAEPGPGGPAAGRPSW